MKLMQQRQAIRQRAPLERVTKGNEFDEDYYYRCQWMDLLAVAIDVIARLESHISPNDVIEIVTDLGVHQKDAKAYLMKHGFIQDDAIKPSREEIAVTVGGGNARRLDLQANVPSHA